MAPTEDNHQADVPAGCARPAGSYNDTRHYQDPNQSKRGVAGAGVATPRRSRTRFSHLRTRTHRLGRTGALPLQAGHRLDSGHRRGRRRTGSALPRHVPRAAESETGPGGGGQFSATADSAAQLPTARSCRRRRRRRTAVALLNAEDLERER